MTAAASPRPDPSDEPSALLPTDIPARGARLAGLLIFVVVLAAAAFAVLVPLPETVRAPFQLVPEDGEDPIQAPIAGTLAEIAVREGSIVRAGEPLVRIRSDDVRNARSRLQQLGEESRALAERRERLENAHRTDVALKEAEIVQAERELGFRDKHLATIRDLVRRSEQLAKSGSLSPVELLARQLDEAESEKNRTVTEKLVQQLGLQKQELAAARGRFRAEEAAEAEKLRVQQTALQEQLRDTEGDFRIVRAPYDAVVTRVAQRTSGGVVSIGTEICLLARPGAPLRARLQLPESILARVSVAQRAQLFFDSLPYQRHGTATADITWISPAPVGTGADRHFFALASLRAGETRLPLGPGLAGEARVRIGYRTLVQRALDPLRGARELLRGN